MGLDAPIDSPSLGTAESIGGGVGLGAAGSWKREALRGMPSGRDERREALEKIRHQVQVLLQPQLKHALQNMHTRLAPLQQCVSLYAALNKIDVLQQEYVANRPATIHKAWFAYRGGEDALVTWLPTWYDAVLSLLTEERRQSLAVFGPDRAPVMIGKVR
jgi:hypothetical protein